MARATLLLGALTALACLVLPVASRALRAQTSRPITIDNATVHVDSAALARAAHRAASRTVPTRRWIPRHVSIGVGGVATSPPGRGATYAPNIGGAFDVGAIGYVTPTLAWRAEAFLHLHDRSVTSEAGLLASQCVEGDCAAVPRETARRSSGMGLGIEYHPMRGRVGVYTVAVLGAAGTNSFGNAGRSFGFAPSAGIGILAPLSTGLDGFAIEGRWRRVPTPIGAVNAGALSFVLRF